MGATYFQFSQKKKHYTYCNCIEMFFFLNKKSVLWILVIEKEEVKIMRMFKYYNEILLTARPTKFVTRYTLLNSLYYYKTKFEEYVYLSFVKHFFLYYS